MNVNHGLELLESYAVFEELLKIGSKPEKQQHEKRIFCSNEFVIQIISGKRQKLTLE